jgi:peptidoglycan/xylan/chitin deacetylase (PgdA/CDA1 family)
LSVLIFHRVLAAPDLLQPGEPTVEDFERQMRWVKAWFNVLPLSVAMQKLRANNLPERPLAITFDDGYADNHDLALPVLERIGLSATFFVATRFLDGGRMFNDTVIESLRQFGGTVLDLAELGLGVHQTETAEARRRAIRILLPQVKYLDPQRRSVVVERIAHLAGARLPANLMMTSRQVAALVDRGMEVGGHTASHPILARLDPQDARREIADGRNALEQIVGRPVSIFAYPNGQPNADYTRSTVAVVRELGFDAAVTTSHGTARIGADPYQVPRFTPWSPEAWRYAAQLWRNVASVRPQLADA